METAIDKDKASFVTPSTWIDSTNNPSTCGVNTFFVLVCRPTLISVWIQTISTKCQPCWREWWGYCDVISSNMLTHYTTISKVPGHNHDNAPMKSQQHITRQPKGASVANNIHLQGVWNVTTRPDENMTSSYVALPIEQMGRGLNIYLLLIATYSWLGKEWYV